jgi:hypothetical protein
MGLAHLRVPGLARGPQEPEHRRGLSRAQVAQELAHRRGPGRVLGPQELAHRRGPGQAQEPQHLRVLGLVKGMELLRVRLMESPQLGELLESLPEAVLFPHLHRQKP